jgi:enamine deaminase RidA (YjgF/YER057c/UK114 family)
MSVCGEEHRVCAIRIIMISGIVSVDEKHRDLHPGDLEAQTRGIYEQMEKLLKKAGATFDDAIKTVDYITPWALVDYFQAEHFSEFSIHKFKRLEFSEKIDSKFKIKVLMHSMSERR